MNIQTAVKGRIETVRVIGAKGNYVKLEIDGKVIERFHPRYAKKFQEESKECKSTKSKTKEPVPKERWDKLNPNKLDVKNHNVNHGVVVNKPAMVCDCKKCLRMAANECIGRQDYCEFYKPSPQNVKYY